MDKLLQLFSIDVRSLALVRVALAVIVLQDLARRSFDLVVFYGDAGVLPSEYLHSFWNGALSWSLHLIDGGPVWILATLFAIHALAAAALLVGFHTRIATVITWLLVVSLHNANPLILQGEDVLLRVVLFVCMFLPLGAAYSVDRLRSGAHETTFLSGWTVAYLLQIGFVYFFVSLYKHSPEWINGDAIYYALSIDQYATPLGKYLLNFPVILSFFTVAVLVFQSLALFLLFSPWKTVWVRSVTVFLLMLMHAAFAVSMNLGMFSAVSIAALCGFLPSEMWDALERFAASRARSLRTVIEKMSVTAALSVQQVTTVQAFLSLLGILYIFYIFFWHGLNVVNPGQYVAFSHGFEVPAKVLRLDQRWNLFAPYPYRDDGWVIVDAVREGGEHIDLFRDGELVSYERPDVIYDLYPRPRWRRYFLSLRLEGNADFRELYVQYLCKQWDGGELPNVTALSLVYMREWTPKPGETAPPVQPVTLISWDCETDREVQAK